MKKILIVSDYFFPSTNIGAVRPSKIAKALKKDVYELDVFTRYPIDSDSELYCDNYYCFSERPVQGVGGFQMKSEERTGLKKFLFDRFTAIYKALYKIKAAKKANKSSAEMLNAFKAFIAKSDKEYDVVFSTFGPLSSLLCGLWYKKQHPSVKWICDFRDPAVVSQLGPFRNLFMLIKQQQACKVADEIITVSNGYLERICGEKYKEKRHMIPNGYDREDLKFNAATSKVSDCLELVYVGILYGEMRDITPVFSALDELIKEGKIDKSKVRFNYAGNDLKNLVIQAEKSGLADIVADHGLLPREKCLELQFSSDLLVLSTWNTKKEYGVFPGKMLEYMLIGKPIVTTVSGDVPNSEVARVIREGNLGTVYESTNSVEDMKALKSYLKEAYDAKILGGSIPFNPNQAVTERYNYTNIIGRIEAIIEK